VSSDPGWESDLLPESTREDTPEGWGDVDVTNDERLEDERPPHW
jgi:hypothetical protein